MTGATRATLDVRTPEGVTLPFEIGGAVDRMGALAIDVALVMVTSVVVALFGLLYVRVFYGTTSLMGRIPVPPHFRPAIGALLTGLLAVGIYYGASEDQRSLAVLSSGYGIIQETLDPRIVKHPFRVAQWPHYKTCIEFAGR